MKKFVVSFISTLLLSLSFISVIPASAVSGSGGGSSAGVVWSEVSDITDIPHSSDVLARFAKSFGTIPKQYALIYTKDSSGEVNTSMIWLPDDAIFCYCFSVSQFRYLSKSDLISSRLSMYWNSDGYISSSSYAPFRFDKSPSPDYKYSGILYHFGVDGFDITSGKVYINSTVYDWDNFDTQLSFGAVKFKPPVNAQFDFKSDIEFFCCLKDNVSLPCDNRVWIEVYDSAPAIEKLVYKPYKYVYTKTTTSSSPDIPNKHEQVIGDYLLANSVGPYYSISVDTLLHAGCSPDSFYTARAYVYRNGEPFEIANLTFKISSEGLSTVDTTLQDPDHPDDPIMKTWNNDNRSYVYNNVNTGAEVDKDKLVYKFDSIVDPTVNGSGHDISDFDFNSDFSTDLTQGAGLVRTLFDKILETAGLSGFMISVLSVAVVGWFIFGSRR